MAEDNVAVILVSKDCGHCEALKQKHKDKIESGELKLLDVDTDEGRNFIDVLNIRAVPTIVGMEFTKEDNLTVCRLNNLTLEQEECIEIPNEKTS